MTPESTEFQCDDSPFVISRLRSRREPPRDPPSLSDTQFLGSISLLCFCSLLYYLYHVQDASLTRPARLLWAHSLFSQPVSGGWSRRLSLCPSVCSLVPLSRVCTAADFGGSPSQLTSKCRSVCKDFKLHGDKPLLGLLMF